MWQSVSVIIETSKSITLKIKSLNFLFKEKFADPQKFQPSKYSGYMIYDNILQCDNIVLLSCVICNLACDDIVLLSCVICNLACDDIVLLSCVICNLAWGNSAYVHEIQLLF